MIRTRCALVLGAAMFTVISCADPAAPAVRVSSDATTPAFELVMMEFERVVTEEEFALADLDKANGICVKGTSSTDLLMKDANAATPSQPCPPAWQFLGKPMAIKIQKEWFTEDRNGNGLVCVKFVGDEKTIVKDDNTSTPSQPCPPSFSPVGKTPSGPKVSAEDLADADDNKNSQVCVNAVPSGNFIARDDNEATPSQPCPPSWYLFTGAKREDPAPTA